MKMKKTLTTLSACLLMAGASQAVLVSFNNLTTQFDSAGNSLGAGGFTTADTELVVTGAASGNNFIYSVTYTGQSYDGDLTNDTLTFDVLVEGLNGSSATAPFLSSEADVNANNGIVTAIGTTDTAVDITGDRWSVGGSVMSAGNTLKFTLQNFSVITSLGSYTASLNSFTGTSYQETGNGYGHIAVIGDVGTGLFASRFNATNYNIVNLLSEGNPLYITSAQLDDPNQPSANPQRWAVSNVDFGINIIPEPSSFALLLGGLGFLVLRRRRN